MIRSQLTGSRTLSILVERIRFSALVVSCAFIYLSASIALAFQWKSASVTDLFILMVPLAVAVTAFVATRDVVRGALITASTATFLLAILMIESSGDVLWPPIASMCFSLGVIAVSTLPVPAAVAVVALATAFTRAGVILKPPRTFLISTDLIDGWVTPLSVLSLSLAFLLVLRAWTSAASRADDASAQVRTQLAEALLAENVDEARRSVDRRLHETLLNTLASLSAPVYDANALREQCKRDLTSVSSEDSIADLRLGSVVNEALRRVPVVEAHIECFEGIQVPDTRSAHVVGDAIVELLRNIDRHSGTHEAWISCRKTGTGLDILVADKGVGFSFTTERFGLRSAVAESMKSIGGWATFEPNEPTGTCAVLHLELDRRIDQLEPPTALNVLLGSATARIALAPTLMLGIVAMPFAVAGFALTFLILLGFALTLIAATTLALGWLRLPRQALAWIVMASSLITMTMASFGQHGCSTATGLHWIIYVEAGAITLAVLTFRSLYSRALLTGVVIIASLLASLFTPTECIIEPLDAAFENAIWIIACISVISLLSALMDRHRVQEYALWLDLQKTAAVVAARESAEARWRAVNSRTWSLLGGIVSGTLEPGSEEVQAQARVQEARLRALLDVGQVPSVQLQGQVEQLADGAGDSGVPLSIQVLDDDPNALLSEAEMEQLEQLLILANGKPVQLVILPDSVMCQVPHGIPTPQDLATNATDDGLRMIVTIPRLLARV